MLAPSTVYLTLREHSPSGFLLLLGQTCRMVAFVHPIIRRVRSPKHIAVSLVVTFAFFAGLAGAAGGQTKSCTEKDAKDALNLPDNYRDWNAAYRSFQRFGQCDDGAIAEGFSEAIAQLLAKDWKKHVDALIRLATNDKKFERFVLRHVDETLSDDELRTIAENARLYCPNGEKPFCRLILTRAQNSLTAQQKVPK
jgi:hypothetical protein